MYYYSHLFVGAIGKGRLGGAGDALRGAGGRREALHASAGCSGLAQGWENHIIQICTYYSDLEACKKTYINQISILGNICLTLFTTNESDFCGSMVNNFVLTKKPFGEVFVHTKLIFKKPPCIKFVFFFMKLEIRTISIWWSVFPFREISLRLYVSHLRHTESDYKGH